MESLTPPKGFPPKLVEYAPSLVRRHLQSLPEMDRAALLRKVQAPLEAELAGHRRTRKAVERAWRYARAVVGHTLRAANKVRSPDGNLAAAARKLRRYLHQDNVPFAAYANKAKQFKVLLDKRGADINARKPARSEETISLPLDYSIRIVVSPHELAVLGREHNFCVADARGPGPRYRRMLARKEAQFWALFSPDGFVALLLLSETPSRVRVEEIKGHDNKRFEAPAVVMQAAREQLGYQGRLPELDEIGDFPLGKYTKPEQARFAGHYQLAGEVYAYRLEPGILTLEYPGRRGRRLWASIRRQRSPEQVRWVTDVPGARARLDHLMSETDCVQRLLAEIPPLPRLPRRRTLRRTKT